MVTISLVLLIAAFIVFALAALWIPGPPRPNMIALGLALWTLSQLLGALTK